MGNIEEVLGTGAYTDTVIRSVGAGCAAGDRAQPGDQVAACAYIAKLAKPWARRALNASATPPLWAGYP